MSQIRSTFETNSHLCWSPFQITLPHPSVRPSVCKLRNDSIIADRNFLNFDFGNSMRNCRHISVLTKIRHTIAIPSFEGHSASLLNILFFWDMALFRWSCICRRFVGSCLLTLKKELMWPSKRRELLARPYWFSSQNALLFQQQSICTNTCISDGIFSACTHHPTRKIKYFFSL